MIQLEEIERIGEYVMNATMTIRIPVTPEAQEVSKPNDKQFVETISQEMADFLQEELDWLMEENTGISGLVSDVSCDALYVAIEQEVQ